MGNEMTGDIPKKSNIDETDLKHPEKENIEKNSIFENKVLRYIYLSCIFVFMLICAYFLFFSGDLFIESVMNGWYGSEVSEFDKNSFFYGLFYCFASLVGLMGCITVLITRKPVYYKFKVVFFIFPVFWSTLLVLDFFLNGMEYLTTYMTLLFYHIPVMLLSWFVFLCVIKDVDPPIRILKPKKKEIITEQPKADTIAGN
jgi:hypothetical protein